MADGWHFCCCVEEIVQKLLSHYAHMEIGMFVCGRRWVEMQKLMKYATWEIIFLAKNSYTDLNNPLLLLD